MRGAKALERWQPRGVIDDPEIERLRTEIDAIDRELLSVIRKRIGVVLSVGELKRQKRLPIHDPAREDVLLERLNEDTRAPLDARLVREVFGALVRECRRIETERHENAP